MSSSIFSSQIVSNFCDEASKRHRGVEQPIWPSGLPARDIWGRGTYVNGTCLARKVRGGIRRETRAPPHLRPRLRAALRSRGWWWRVPGERVWDSLLRPGRRRQSSERRRDASLPRPSILLVRVILTHPVQVWFARHSTGRTRRTFTCYFTQQDIPRRPSPQKSLRDTEGATTA